ncbi:MAG: hypothetical protein KDE15_03315 [Erythrobacter sp.]|nr:hypothetical protein [Erythrobacter sp.]
MEMNDLLHRYFGTYDLAAVDPRSLAGGIDHMLVDFGLEQDRGRRFALWSMLFMLDAAPDLDLAFEDEEDREAARNFMDLLAASGPA